MKQLATTLTDAATPQWHGTMSRVGMVGMMELMAFRWCLWLGGVHALREASTRKVEEGAAMAASGATAATAGDAVLPSHRHAVRRGAHAHHLS